MSDTASDLAATPGVYPRPGYLILAVLGPHSEPYEFPICSTLPISIRA